MVFNFSHLRATIRVGKIALYLGQTIYCLKLAMWLTEFLDPKMRTHHIIGSQNNPNDPKMWPPRYLVWPQKWLFHCMYGITTLSRLTYLVARQRKPPHQSFICDPKVRCPPNASVEESVQSPTVLNVITTIAQYSNMAEYTWQDVIWNT